MNFEAYLKHQKAEDRRAFIIHYPPCSGKTQFAQRLAKTHAEIAYLDLLEYYLAHPELPAMAQFDCKALRMLLLSLETPQAVIVIDHPDFLFNTWSVSEKQALLHWLGVELRSPADSEIVFIFMIQDDETLAMADFRNVYGEPRVLALEVFEAV